VDQPPCIGWASPVRPAGPYTRVAVAQVDQPLCIDCASRVREEMEAMTVEIEAECEAYEQALQRLELGNAQPLSEEVRCQACNSFTRLSVASDWCKEHSADPVLWCIT